MLHRHSQLSFLTVTQRAFLKQLSQPEAYTDELPHFFSSHTKKTPQQICRGSRDAPPKNKHIFKIIPNCIFNPLLYKFWLFSFLYFSLNYFKIILWLSGCCSFVLYWCPCLHWPNSACVWLCTMLYATLRVDRSPSSLAENEGKGERGLPGELDWLLTREREFGCQFINLSQQKQSMLLRLNRNWSQAGIIFSSTSVSLTFVNERPS